MNDNCNIIMVTLHLIKANIQMLLNASIIKFMYQAHTKKAIGYRCIINALFDSNTEGVCPVKQCDNFIGFGNKYAMIRIYASVKHSRCPYVALGKCAYYCVYIASIYEYKGLHLVSMM